MPDTDLGWTARVVVFQRIDDYAERAGVTPANVKRAVATAEAAGFIVMHVNEPKAILTAKDRHAAKR